MATVRTRVDLSVKTDIYTKAQARLKWLQRKERRTIGVQQTTLTDIARSAILNYSDEVGGTYAPRVVRSPNGQAPKRTVFRFDMSATEYEKQKRRIIKNGHKVTQVVEEALKRFTDNGTLPSN